MINQTQLDIMSGLMAKETKEQQFVDEILHELKNLKYLRAELERAQSFYPDTDPSFKYASSASNSMGSALFFLATMGYLNSRGITKFKDKDRDWFYNKTISQGIYSTQEGRSYTNLYDMSRKTKSALEAFILANRKYIDKSRMNNSLSVHILDSMDNVINYIKSAIK